MCYFTIISPTYNRASRLKATIESVLRQKFEDFEYIIVDDGSTDNTEEVVKSYDDKRIKYFKQENKERGAARNLGIQKSNGKYLTFLDSDDTLYNNHLSEAHEFIKANNVRFFVNSYDIKDDKGSIINKVNSYKEKTTINQMLFNNTFSISFFAEKGMLLKYNFLEDRNFVFAEDLLIMLKLSTITPLVHNPTITFSVINHDSRSVINPEIKTLKYCFDKTLKELNGNNEFMSKFGHKLSILEANQLSLLSLYSSSLGDKKKAFGYLVKSLLKYYKLIFHIRTYIIIKKIILN